MNDWFIYIVRCSDHSLYTGITRDIERRVHEHNFGKRAAAYTRTRRPVKLVYLEEHHNRSSAAKREIAIKKMNKTAKELMVGGSGFG